MHVTINGDPRDVPADSTVRSVVALFNLVPEKVAIELNRRLVRPGGYDSNLSEGDVIEIVTFVGGGAA